MRDKNRPKCGNLAQLQDLTRVVGMAAAAVRRGGARGGAFPQHDARAVRRSAGALEKNGRGGESCSGEKR